MAPASAAVASMLRSPAHTSKQRKKQRREESPSRGRVLRRPILEKRGQIADMVAHAVCSRTAEAQAYACMVADAVSARAAVAHAFVSVVAYAILAKCAKVPAFVSTCA